MKVISRESFFERLAGSESFRRNSLIIPMKTQSVSRASLTFTVHGIRCPESQLGDRGRRFDVIKFRSPYRSRAGIRCAVIVQWAAMTDGSAKVEEVRRELVGLEGAAHGLLPEGEEGLSESRTGARKSEGGNQCYEAEPRIACAAGGKYSCSTYAEASCPGAEVVEQPTTARRNSLTVEIYAKKGITGTSVAETSKAVHSIGEEKEDGNKRGVRED
jgi:hypothetical protein